jgi:hypothetical protein
MARAPYDTTCDIIDGPGTATPGNVRHANVPCRVVDDSIVRQREKWLDLEAAYVTMDETDVHAAFVFAVPPDYTITPANCDRLAIPTGAAATHTVLWTESVTQGTDPVYYRAHVKLGA